MKKIIVLITMLAAVGTANAQWHHHRPYYGPTVVYRDNWVTPLIIGGIAGAVIANANQQPVVVQQQPVIVQREIVCNEWKEIQTPDGQIYRERTCFQR